MLIWFVSHLIHLCFQCSLISLLPHFSGPDTSHSKSKHFLFGMSTWLSASSKTSLLKSQPPSLTHHSFQVPVLMRSYPSNMPSTCDWAFNPPRTSLSQEVNSLHNTATVRLSAIYFLFICSAKYVAKVVHLIVTNKEWLFTELDMRFLLLLDGGWQRNFLPFSIRNVSISSPSVDLGTNGLLWADFSPCSLAFISLSCLHTHTQIF